MEGKIKHRSGQSPCFFFLDLFLLTFLAAPWANSQMPPESDSSPPAGRTPAIDTTLVGVMAFRRNNFIQSRQLYDIVIREAKRLEGYTPRQFSFLELPNPANLPPDRAPDPAYWDAARYVLTGEYYIDNEDVWHLQLWLWDSADGSLVYTDEEIAENMAEAEGYLPALLGWILSHISVEQTITPPAPGEAGEEDRPVFIMRMYLGLRGGGSFNVYFLPRISESYESSIGQSFTNEAAFFAEFKVFRFLSLQAEAVLVPDFLRISKLVQNGGTNIRVTDDFRSLSLIFPLLIKTPFRLGIFASSFYTGAYLTIPLGNTKMKNGDPAVPDGSYGFKINQCFGILLGLDLGFSLGPGELLFDLRYTRDFGQTIIQTVPELPYVRSRISLTAGYKFLLWKRS